MARGEQDDVDRLAKDGLAEGYRLASEAREAIRSRYEDWMLVILIFALGLWGALLFAIVLSGALAVGPGPLVMSLIAVAAVSVPMFIACRRRFRALIAEQDRWIARLSGGAAPGSEISRFDLLVDVSRQVPVWLSIREKEHFRRHPFLITAMFISGAAVLYITVLAGIHLGDSSFIYLVLMLLPFLALLIGTALAERTAVRREREAILARWRERTESSRQAMEELLGGI